MKRNFTRTMLTLVVSALLVSGVYAADDDHTLTIALDSDIVALDPIFAYDFTTNPVINQITQGLLQFDVNNQLQPLLASSWEVVDDLTYVYQIREDVCFSDGSPMTMDDVLFSLGRNMDPEQGSYLSWMFDAVDSLEQTGDWELTVHLKEPYATWQYVPGTTAAHVISKAYYEEHADDFGTAQGGLMGTGPYVYESWSGGREVVLRRNENYWDKDQKLEMDTLVYKVIQDDTQRVLALQTGEVDFTPATPSDMLDTLKADENLDVQDVATAGITFLAFNTQREPFNDVNVRKAITAAIDLGAIQDYIVEEAGQKGGCLPGSEVLFAADEEGWKAYLDQASYISYDPEAAKAYLAESSYPDGFSCNMIITENSLRYSMALYIQEALKEIGIDVELERVSADEHTAYQFGEIFDADGYRDYDMIMAGWEADYPDLAANIEPLVAGYYTGEGGSNSAAYSNEEVDRLVTEASACTDQRERTILLGQVMDIVNEDCPYVFLNYPNRQATCNKKYKGFTMNASWLWNLYFKDMVLA
ncbi:MAG: ABC transporter substrate-binding protein [Blautia sp.]|nr:ABC transporter substrate-binding protein [Blautia sp.]